MDEKMKMEWKIEELRLIANSLQNDLDEINVREIYIPHVQ